MFVLKNLGPTTIRGDLPVPYLIGANAEAATDPRTGRPYDESDRAALDRILDPRVVVFREVEIVDEVGTWDFVVAEAPEAGPGEDETEPEADEIPEGFDEFGPLKGTDAWADLSRGEKSAVTRKRKAAAG